MAPYLAGLGGWMLSLRAFRRARDGAAKGRGSWERIHWPDAKFEVTSANGDLRNEQQREKREESREKREERREKREERKEKTEHRPQEAARGPEMRPPEGDQPFLTTCRPGLGPLGATFRDRGQREESREKREERREKIAASSIHCIFRVSRGHSKEVMKIRNGHRKWPQARIPAFLLCPVTTSMGAKTHQKRSF